MSKKHHHKKEYYWTWLIVNSLCAFLTMFISLFFFYYLIQMGIARVFGIQSTLYFDDILFVSAPDAWFPKLILVAYTAPIFAMVLGAAFFYYIHSLLRRSPHLVRLYCLWGYVICIALFICSFIHGYFAYKSFSVIFLWYKMSTRWNDVLALVGVIGLCTAGLFLGVAFLKLAPSQELDMHKHPRKFLILFALLPLLIGKMIIWGFLMRNWQNSIPLLVTPVGIFVMMLFMIIRREPIEERITIVRNLATGKFSPIAVIICVFTIILAKYLIIKGINL